MKHRKSMLAFAFMLIASMALTACQPQTIIQPVEVTKVVEKIVRQTQIVEKTVEQTRVVDAPKHAFTTPHPILSDLKVRQAMAFCTNKADLARAGYPLLAVSEAKKLVMDTFIPKTHWAYAGDENISLYPFDSKKGQELLDEDGWKLPPGSQVREKEKTVLALKLLTPDTAFSQAWTAVWEKQMANCGIQILPIQAPSSWLFGSSTGITVRDFELAAYSVSNQADPGGAALYACDQIPLPENNWSGQNSMGWCNEKASEAIKNANNTLIQEDRKKWYTVAQQEFTRAVPSIPVFNQIENLAASAGLKGFAPLPGEEYYTYNVQDWQLPGKDTIVIGSTHEPATLYLRGKQPFNTRIAASLIGFPRAYTTLNNDFQPYYLTKIPTIESGLAQNNDIVVKEGQKVYDSTGNIKDLQTGVRIKDVTGTDVDYKGGTIKMKQLVVKYEFRSDIKWQDGSPVTQADFELGYKAACDRLSGAATSIACDQTQDIKFDGTSYTVTWLPGLQDPLYFAAPYGFAPSKQPIETDGPYKGKTLAAVPARDWPALKEVTEKPWSSGPYVIKDWVKGVKIAFEANPNFFLGAPKTKKIEISFVSPENAEARLLAGQVNILDSTALAGLSEQLLKGEKERRIKNYIIAGAAWEHIDFNLFVK